MTIITTFVRSATAVALAAAAVAAVAGPSAAAGAQSWDSQHDEVRCEAGSDKCVVLHCVGADFPCVVADSFDRDKAGDWMKPYGFHAVRQARRGEQWTWYGNLHVTCDADGQHCRELEY